MSHITYYDDYGIMAWPNLQTEEEFTVSFVVTSTLRYQLKYVDNYLVDPNWPIVKYPLIVKEIDDNIYN